MTHAGFVFVAYFVTTVGIGGYALRVVRHGRRLSRHVPEGRRRWM